MQAITSQQGLEFLYFVDSPKGEMLITTRTSLMAKAMQLLYQGQLFHSSCLRAASVDKKLLSALRKKTGFTFVNCKKALEKFGSDIEQAEAWLKEQAQKEGWQKALKLQGRQMSQGLVAVMLRENSATMIELNCETDFVARNEKFQELVKNLSTCCQDYFNNSAQNKMLLNKEQVNQIVHGSNSLGDKVAKEVGNIGENMALRRAAYLQTALSPSTWLGSYVHSTQGLAKVTDCAVGKFAAIVTIKPTSDEVPEQNVVEAGQRLAQHIVGMNPTKVGNPDCDEPHADKDQENVLIFQEFLLDSSKTVGQYLSDMSITVQDFVRFECGEVLAEEESNKETVATAAASSS
ncbi:elongation factor Ts, mitochondrial isoform X1 [Octopus sinensis]|uniref:Elongation factor Ts, mitochondrial n=2 Tax=Octopus sinensis TaxID=2607531 RepID=A0A6P7TET0_9MOLL|nr:elongation factor Ts, mitochondrial isoform X1 [Octopus sinensis]